MRRVAAIAALATVLLAAPGAAHAFPIVYTRWPQPPPERSDVLGYSLYHRFGDGWAWNGLPLALSLAADTHYAPVVPVGNASASALAGGLDLRVRWYAGGNFALSFGGTSTLGVAAVGAPRPYGGLGIELAGGWAWWLGDDVDVRLDLVAQLGYYGVNATAADKPQLLVSGGLRATLEVWIDRHTTFDVGVTGVAGNVPDAALSLGFTFHGSSYDGLP